MGSDEKMKERTFVVALQKQLASAKDALRSEGLLDKQFETIEEDLAAIRGALGRSASCEKDVRKDLESSTRDANDISDYSPNFDGKHDAIKKKIESIETNIQRIKATVESSFPEISTSQPSSSGSEDRRKRKGILEEKQNLSTTSDNQWKRLEPVLEKRILDHPAMKHLSVSYDNLETQLKLCLLCLAVFPEGKEIKKRVLIYWWIGEGLVAPKGEKPAEEVGEECFEKLVGLSLIQPIFAKPGNLVHRCKVHPWIRRMLVSIAREARFFDLDLQGKPIPATDSKSISRRACLVKSPTGVSTSADSELNNLISLINVDENIVGLKKEWISVMKKVVVLQLGRWQSETTHHIEVENIDVLTGLGSLQHLRYLSLRGISRITEIPDSIKELSNLKILDLRACHNLEKLPAGITSLKRLTHFDATECYLLDHMPKGLGSLTDLQVLKGFVFGTSSRSSKFTELTKLEKLRKLSINIGIDVQIKTELNDLNKFKSLRSLTIVWSGEVPKAKGAAGKLSKGLSKLLSMPRGSATTPAPTATLTPPATLEKLDLRCFPGYQTPDWLRGFDKLKGLYIRGGQLRDLTLVGKWEKLEVLRLKFLKKLASDWPELQKALPASCKVQIVQCSKLKNPPQCDEYGVWVNRVVVQEASTSSDLTPIEE